MDRSRQRPRRSEEKEESNGLLRIPFLILAVWIPYWLWAESTIPETIKFATQTFLSKTCGQRYLNSPMMREQMLNPALVGKSDADLSVCANQEIDFVSANVAIFSSAVQMKVAQDKTQPSQIRYFRIHFDWSNKKWVVDDETSTQGYYSVF